MAAAQSAGRCGGRCPMARKPAVRLAQVDDGRLWTFHVTASAYGRMDASYRAATAPSNEDHTPAITQPRCTSGLFGVYVAIAAAPCADWKSPAESESSLSR